MEDPFIKTHTISVLVENKFGALARIAGLFSGRGYNIESLSVNHTHDPNVSRMTIVTNGTDEILEQIEKQLDKLVDVISVEDVTLLSHIERGLALLKVKCTAKKRAEILQLAETFHAQVLAIKHDAIYIEISGDPEQIDEFVTLMNEYGVLELARSGRTAIRKD
ncbi:MAG: acetolactate synthase small subunit [Lentisphaeria bacterium]|nr:acetolactate synthase small subunit [Lentisphaeria bacterium]